MAKYQQKRIFVGNPRTTITTTNIAATINNNNNYLQPNIATTNSKKTGIENI